MKKVTMAVLAAVFAFVLFAAPAQAQGVFEVCPEGVNSSSAVCGDTSDAEGLVKTIVNIMLYMIGILSVVMIIHSGLKYVTSRGDAEMIKSAKNTLLYAVIGLIVALSSFIIVNFVIGSFGGNDHFTPEERARYERCGDAPPSSCQ